MKIHKELKIELFEILYTIEDIEYNSELGKKVGNLLTKLEKMKKNVDVSKEINSAYIELKSNEMEFIDEITTQLTEQTFGENTWESREWDSENEDHCVNGFTDDAQDFYNERYDEFETLYINLIKKQ